MDAVAVALSGLESGYVGVPDVAVDFGDFEAFFVAFVIDEAEFYAFGYFGEEGEVDAGSVVGGAEGVGVSGPELHVAFLVHVVGRCWWRLRCARCDVAASGRVVSEFRCVARA